MQNLRFDESLGQQHGYDLDICMQARTAGKKVVTADFRVIHHHSLRLIEDVESWIQAHMKLAEKWDEHLPKNGTPIDWKQRARRAEAEASVARLIGGVEELIRVAQYKELEELRNSKSWRLLAPLRAVAGRIRERRGA